MTLRLRLGDGWAGTAVWLRPSVSGRLTLCALFEQRLRHLEPEGAALTRRLPGHLEALCGTSAVEEDRVDHRQIVPKWGGEKKWSLFRDQSSFAFFLPFQSDKQSCVLMMNL